MLQGIGTLCGQKTAVEPRLSYCSSVSVWCSVVCRQPWCCDTAVQWASAVLLCAGSWADRILITEYGMAVMQPQVLTQLCQSKNRGEPNTHFLLSSSRVCCVVGFIDWWGVLTPKQLHQDAQSHLDSMIGDMTSKPSRTKLWQTS